MAPVGSVRRRAAGSAASLRSEPSSGTNTVRIACGTAASGCGGINRVGRPDVRTTRSATDPSRQRLKPERPCVAITIISASIAFARSTIVSSGSPIPTSTAQSTPAGPRIPSPCACRCSCRSANSRFSICLATLAVTTSSKPAGRSHDQNRRIGASNARATKIATSSARSASAEPSLGTRIGFVIESTSSSAAERTRAPRSHDQHHPRRGQAPQVAA